MSNPITLEEVEETLDLANRLGLIVRCPPGRGQCTPRHLSVVTMPTSWVRGARNDQVPPSTGGVMCVNFDVCLSSAVRPARTYAEFVVGWPHARSGVTGSEECLRSGLSLDAAGSAYEPQPVMSSVVRASRKHRAS